MTIKQVTPKDKLYILQQGEREHVMFAKFLREFVLVLGRKKKSAGLQFNISIRKLKLSVPQRRQESHAEMSPLKLPQVSHEFLLCITVAIHFCYCLISLSPCC